MAIKTDAEILAEARDSNDPKTRLLYLIVRGVWDTEHAVVHQRDQSVEDYDHCHPHIDLPTT
jgi:hypothetical protein